MTLHKISNFLALFAKLPFPHWMNLDHDNYPPCLTLCNPRCLSLRFLPFSTSNVWTKIILHHVWRLRKDIQVSGWCYMLTATFCLHTEFLKKKISFEKFDVDDWLNQEETKRKNKISRKRKSGRLEVKSPHIISVLINDWYCHKWFWHISRTLHLVAWHQIFH